MRTYYVVHVYGQGCYAVFLLNGQIVHRTAPNPDHNSAHICGNNWIAGTFKQLG